MNRRALLTAAVAAPLAAPAAALAATCAKPIDGGVLKLAVDTMPPGYRVGSLIYIDYGSHEVLKGWVQPRGGADGPLLWFSPTAPHWQVQP